MNPLISLSGGLRFAAVVYILTLPIVAFAIYKALSFKSIEYENIPLLVGFGIAALFVFLSFFKLTYPRRMIFRTLLVYAIGFPPIIMLFSSISFIYLFTVGESELFWLSFQILVYIAVWSAYLVRQRQQVLAKTKFLAKYFVVNDREIIYREPLKIQGLFDAPQISDNTTLGRLWNKLISKIGFLLFSAYPIMRLLTATGGDSAFFLFLFILGGPLCLYMIARSIAGGYTWVYKIWQMEKQYCKPVMFPLEKES